MHCYFCKLLTPVKGQGPFQESRSTSTVQIVSFVQHLVLAQGDSLQA